jgi:hypothetical protein
MRATSRGRLPGCGAMKTRRLWLRLVVAGGLAVDAYVHWNLAPDFDSFVGAGPHHVSQGQLFRVEAVLAAIALLLVLFVDHLLAAVLAFVTAAGGLGAVLLYRYVDVGAFGPLPDMYDPTWYPEKTISVIRAIHLSRLRFVRAYRARVVWRGGGPS